MDYLSSELIKFIQRHKIDITTEPLVGIFRDIELKMRTPQIKNILFNSQQEFVDSLTDNDVAPEEKKKLLTSLNILRLRYKELQRVVVVDREKLRLHRKYAKFSQNNATDISVINHYLYEVLGGDLVEACAYGTVYGKKVIENFKPPLFTDLHNRVDFELQKRRFIYNVIMLLAAFSKYIETSLPEYDYSNSTLNDPFSIIIHLIKTNFEIRNSITTNLMSYSEVQHYSKLINLESDRVKKSKTVDEKPKKSRKLKTVEVEKTVEIEKNLKNLKNFKNLKKA